MKSIAREIEMRDEIEKIHVVRPSAVGGIRHPTVPFLWQVRKLRKVQRKHEPRETSS